MGRAAFYSLPLYPLIVPRYPAVSQVAFILQVKGTGGEKKKLADVHRLQFQGH